MSLLNHAENNFLHGWRPRQNITVITELPSPQSSQSYPRHSHHRVTLATVITELPEGNSVNKYDTFRRELCVIVISYQPTQSSLRIFEKVLSFVLRVTL